MVFGSVDARNVFISHAAVTACRSNMTNSCAGRDAVRVGSSLAIKNVFFGFVAVRAAV